MLKYCLLFFFIILSFWKSFDSDIAKESGFFYKIRTDYFQRHFPVTFCLQSSVFQRQIFSSSLFSDNAKRTSSDRIDLTLTSAEPPNKKVQHCEMTKYSHSSFQKALLSLKFSENFNHKISKTFQDYASKKNKEQSILHSIIKIVINNKDNRIHMGGSLINKNDLITSIIKIFCQCGGDLNQQNSHEDTIFHYLLSTVPFKNFSLTFLQDVISFSTRKINFNITNRDQETCFQVAIKQRADYAFQKHLRLILSMLCHLKLEHLTNIETINLNQQNSQGNTLFHLVCQKYLKLKPTLINFDNFKYYFQLVFQLETKRIVSPINVHVLNNNHQAFYHLLSPLAQTIPQNQKVLSEIFDIFSDQKIKAFFPSKETLFSLDLYDNSLFVILCLLDQYKKRKLSIEFTMNDIFVNTSGLSMVQMVIKAILRECYPHILQSLLQKNMTQENFDNFFTIVTILINSQLINYKQLKIAFNYIPDEIIKQYLMKQSFGTSLFVNSAPMSFLLEEYDRLKVPIFFSTSDIKSLENDLWEEKLDCQHFNWLSTLLEGQYFSVLQFILDSLKNKPALRFKAKFLTRITYKILVAILHSSQELCLLDNFLEKSFLFSSISNKSFFIVLNDIYTKNGNPILLLLLQEKKQNLSLLLKIYEKKRVVLPMSSTEIFLSENISQDMQDYLVTNILEKGYFFIFQSLLNQTNMLPINKQRVMDLFFQKLNNDLTLSRFFYKDFLFLILMFSKDSTNFKALIMNKYLFLLKDFILQKESQNVLSQNLYLFFFLIVFPEDLTQKPFLSPKLLKKEKQKFFLRQMIIYDNVNSLTCNKDEESIAQMFREEQHVLHSLYQVEKNVDMTTAVSVYQLFIQKLNYLHNLCLQSS